MKKIISILVLPLILISCGKGYQEPPFGGMNGKVERVTASHHEPEIWHAGSRETDVYFMTASAYDMYGNEICSAKMDSAGRIQSEAENIFDNGICLRSTQKSNGHILVQLVFRSAKKNILEYDKSYSGKTVRMTVRKTSWGRNYKSVVTEDGTVTTISKIKTDKSGFPEVITITDVQNDKTTVERNVFDERHNIVEKHRSVQGEQEDEVSYIRYFDFDEYGNWREARIFNKNHLPTEVILREIEYWE